MPRAPFIKHLSQISVTKPEPAPEKLSYLNQDRKIINSKKNKTLNIKYCCRSLLFCYCSSVGHLTGLHVYCKSLVTSSSYCYFTSWERVLILGLTVF